MPPSTVPRTDMTGHPSFDDYLEYADFVQNNWASQTVLHWLTGGGKEEKKNRLVDLFMLTGEAGCGKSVALHRLWTLMKQIKCEDMAAFCATTHNAKDLLPSDSAPATYHNTFGIDAELIAVESTREFCRLYSVKYGNLAREWLRLTSRDSLFNRHCEKCSLFNTRCYRCCRVVKRALSSWAQCSRPPPRVIWSSLVVIDEYGMLSTRDLDKIMFVLHFFRPPSTTDDRRLLILSGSVSQLSTAAESSGVWHNKLFSSPLLRWTTCLSVNRRLSSDVEFERSLSFMQYNLITREAQALLNSRVVGPERCVDCQFVPDVTRIFNSNQEKTRYNESLARLRGEIELPRTIVRRRAPTHGTTQETFYQVIKKRFPKIFTERSWNPSRASALVARGAPAMLKEGNGDSRLVIPLELTKENSLRVRCADDCDLEVQRMSFEHDGFQGTFYPIYSTAGINTFCAQGATLETGVVYCPPRAYHLSPIKASAYVAMSRVPCRERLWLSLNPFRAGSFPFFSTANVLFRQTVELGYAAPICHNGDTSEVLSKGKEKKKPLEEDDGEDEEDGNDSAIFCGECS